MLCAAVAAAALVGGETAAAAGDAVGPLEVCAFVSDGDMTNTEVVKVYATGSTGIKGTLTFAGAGLNQTVPFKMGKGGIALNSLTIASGGKATVTVELATKPPKRRVLHVLLKTTMDDSSQAGCAPK
jgi:hypothetical protein